MAFVFHFPDQYRLSDEGSNSQEGSRPNSHKFWWSPENRVHPYGKGFIPQIFEIQSLPEPFEPAANQHFKMKCLRQWRANYSLCQICCGEILQSGWISARRTLLPREMQTAPQPKEGRIKAGKTVTRVRAAQGENPLLPHAMEARQDMDTIYCLNYNCEHWTKS